MGGVRLLVQVSLWEERLSFQSVTQGALFIFRGVNVTFIRRELVVTPHGIVGGDSEGH
jgi:hypothetical protein